MLRRMVLASGNPLGDRLTDFVWAVFLCEVAAFDSDFGLVEEGTGQFS